MATTTAEYDTLPPAQMQILRSIGRHLVGVLREGASESRVNAFTLLFDAGYIRDIPVTGYEGVYLLTAKGADVLAREKLAAMVRRATGESRLDWSKAPNARRT
jgi:hypothetical protein